MNSSWYCSGWWRIELLLQSNHEYEQWNLQERQYATYGKAVAEPLKEFELFETAWIALKGVFVAKF